MLKLKVSGAGVRNVTACLATLKPNPRLSLSEWADSKRILSREDSAEPGNWNTARAEYQRGIMDAVTDPSVDEVVVIKGTQIGWTAILGNAVGYYIDQDPAPILLVQPTVDLGRAWSKERLAPMLRDTPCLRGKVKEARARDSDTTNLYKQFDGGSLNIIGANAPSGLASRPIRIVIFDETDRFPISAGSEGDPMKLASKRQETFWNRKTLKGSTPTIKGFSPIERDYQKSDKRLFHVPCGHCGESQVLRWEQVKWDKSEDGEHLPETAHYGCEHCGVLWTDAERWKAVSKGEWIASAPFRGVAGFHLNQFNSPWVKLESIVREFLEAKGRPELLQVWVNTVLGEVWEEQSETIAAAGLKTHIENYGPNDLSEGVHFATAGVDVQDNRLEVEIVGWGEGDESWGIQYEVLYGDPAQKTVWEALDELLLDRFWTIDGRLVRVRAACVDYRGHHGASVEAFCKKRFRRNIYAIGGQAGPRLIWPKRASKTKHKGTLFIVGVDTAKDAVYGRFKINDPGPGYCHFPDSYDDEWFDQVTVERVATRYREGRPYRVWVKPKDARNEALDCRVYALAARMSLLDSQTKPSTVKADTTEDRHLVEQAIERQQAVGPVIRKRRVRSKGVRM